MASAPLDLIYTPEIFSTQAVGGISRYYYELIRQLRALGERPHVAAGLYINHYLRELPGVTGVYFPFSGKREPTPTPTPAPVAGSSQRRPSLRQLAGRAACRWELARHPRALVHQTYFGETAYLGRRRLIVTVYDLIHELFGDAFPELRNQDAERFKRACCQRADHLIAISAATKADLVRLFGIDPDKITVIYLGDSLGAAAAAGPSTGDREPTLLHVGTRGGYKNFATLLEAYAHSPTLRRQYRLQCFGGGPFSEREQHRFRELGVLDRVDHSSGGDADLARCYANAAAFVCPSLYEGFGLPMLEAMGQGCPTFCGRVGSLPEVAGAAAAGFFDPADAASIAQVLETTLADPARMTGAREAGRQQARLFSWEQCAQETLAVYRRLAAS